MSDYQPNENTNNQDDQELRDLMDRLEQRDKNRRRSSTDGVYFPETTDLITVDETDTTEADLLLQALSGHIYADDHADQNDPAANSEQSCKLKDIPIQMRNREAERFKEEQKQPGRCNTQNAAEKDTGSTDPALCLHKLLSQNAIRNGAGFGFQTI